MKAKRALAPVGILLIGIATSALLVRGKPAAGTTPQASEPLMARILTVEAESLRLRVRSQGTVTPRTESELVAEVPGTITVVGPGLEPGAFFREGDVLALLDARDLELAVARARATLERARAEEEFAKADRDRQQRLRDQGIASEAIVDDTRRTARIAAARRVEAEVDLERSERDLARTQIIAPFDGRTRTRAIDVGRFVSTGTPLARVYAVDYAEVRLPIPDAELAFLDLPLGIEIPPAQAPKVVLSARFRGEEHRWIGHIVRSEAEIDPRTRMVNVIARVARPYDATKRTPLAAGLFVEAEIHGRWVEGVFRVPRSAIGRDNDVWVLDQEDRLRRRSVEVLRFERDHALISSGLVAQDRVSLLESRLAREGLAVRPLAQREVLADEGRPGEPTS